MNETDKGNLAIYIWIFLIILFVIFLKYSSYQSYPENATEYEIRGGSAWGD